jgi:hypothetical protein
MGSVTQSKTNTNDTETANLAMGDNKEVANNTPKSKTHKKTSRFFSGIGMDESTNKRTFYV